MMEVKEYLSFYDKIKEELRFFTNSYVRFLILASLFKNNYAMCEINRLTSINYSSLSNNLRILVTEGYVFQNESKYYLSNVLRLYMGDLINFNNSLNILTEYADFFDNHIVKSITNKAISRLYMLKDSELIENNKKDIYKTQNIIENFLKDCSFIKFLCPYYDFIIINKIENLVKENIDVELVVSSSIINNFNFKVKEFKNNLNLFLLINDKNMAFALYKNDGTFDKNRLLISKDKVALKWALKLFDYYFSK